MWNFQFPGYLFKRLYFTKQWIMFVVISPSASVLHWISSSVTMPLYLLDPGVSRCWVDLWRMWKRGPVAALGLDELLPPSRTHEAWNTIHNKSLNGRSHTQQFTINESWREQQCSAHLVIHQVVTLIAESTSDSFEPEPMWTNKHISAVVWMKPTDLEDIQCSANVSHS